MPNLYIIATPIGNLKDVSQRALEILAQVDLILCEDTRVTRRLLENYKIEKPLLSYHEHSKLKKLEMIVDLINSGKNLALVSDAGTPGILDPGNKLINQLIEYFSQNSQPASQILDLSLLTCRKSTAADRQKSPAKLEEGTADFQSELKIIPIPGPSALITAASICGFDMNKFLFLGFPPTKKKRKKFFEEAIKIKYSVVFYESPYRITKTLCQIQEIRADIQLVVCRELTKHFESIYRGTAGQILENLKRTPIKGEFVVILSKNASKPKKDN